MDLTESIEIPAPVQASTKDVYCQESGGFFNVPLTPPTVEVQGRCYFEPVNTNRH